MPPQQKSYTDLRYKLIRGLLNYEKFQRSRHYLKSSAEWTSRAIVSLELADKPINSVYGACQFEGIGNGISAKLKEILLKNEYGLDPPTNKRFLTSAPAFLVALFDLKTQKQEFERDDSSSFLVSENELNEVAQTLCEEHIKFHDLSGFCAAGWRINILCSRGMIKKRSMHKEPAYELLPFGEQVALHLIGVDKGKVGTSPIKVKHLPKQSELREVPKLTDTLYTNDKGSDGVILLVDIRECGGDACRLGELSRMFDKTTATYQTRKLKIGDYQWVYRINSTEHTLPLIVERKRGDDLANSIVDGRFVNQIEKMQNWTTEFTGTGINMYKKMIYLVEGDLERYVVKCEDGCGGVGKCCNPTAAELQEILNDLDSTEEFCLLRTFNIQKTVDLLVMITDYIKNSINLGEFKQLFLNAENKSVSVAHNFKDTTHEKVLFDQKKSKGICNKFRPECSRKKKVYKKSPSSTQPTPSALIDLDFKDDDYTNSTFNMPSSDDLLLLFDSEPDETEEVEKDSEVTVNIKPALLNLSYDNDIDDSKGKNILKNNSPRSASLGHNAEVLSPSDRESGFLKSPYSFYDSNHDSHHPIQPKNEKRKIASTQAESEIYKPSVDFEDDVSLSNNIEGERKKIKLSDVNGLSAQATELPLPKQKNLSSLDMLSSEETANTSERSDTNKVVLLNTVDTDSNSSSGSTIVVKAEIHCRQPSKEDAEKRNITKSLSSCSGESWIKYRSPWDVEVSDEIVSLPSPVKNSKTSRLICYDTPEFSSPNWSKHRSSPLSGSPPDDHTGNIRSPACRKKLVSDSLETFSNISPSIYGVTPKLADDDGLVPAMLPETKNSKKINPFSDILKSDVKTQIPMTQYSDILDSEDELPDLQVILSTHISPELPKRYESPSKCVKATELSEADLRSVSPMDTDDDKNVDSKSFTQYRTQTVSNDFKSSEWRTQIEIIQNILPHVDTPQILGALNVFNGNIDQALGVLLDS